jgi:hypothetical protein
MPATMLLWIDIPPIPATAPDLPRQIVLDKILPADAAENNDNPLNLFFKSNYLCVNF